MAIQFSIYTCQPIPTAVKSPDPSSRDSGLWSPLSCTLIYTQTSAIIVDCPPSVAATTKLATWIKSTLPTGCILKHFVATHAHGDHFFGFPVLAEHFPGVTAVATQMVIGGVEYQYAPALYENGWKVRFPPTDDGNGLPATRVEFAALPSSNVMDLDGHHIKFYDAPHGDTDANSFLHLPELGLVVAGDIVYNGDCHQWLGEASTSEKRARWLEALSQIGALNPKTVVPGHTFTPALEANEAIARSMLESTKEYIQRFEEELKKVETKEELFERMQSWQPRWNTVLLIQGCAANIRAK